MINGLDNHDSPSRQGTLVVSHADHPATTSGSGSDQMIPNLVEYYARGLVDFGAASVLAMLVVIVVSLLVVVYQRLPKEGQYGRA